MDHGLVMRLVAEKEHSREQQVLHFDESDLLSFITCSLREIGPEVRAELVSRVLGKLSDEELVAALNGEIAKRHPRKAAE